MLQAKLNNGKLIMLAQLSKQTIEHYRRHAHFYCPACKERVVIKAGPKLIPHFAHRRKAACLSQGGEGPYHQQGKLLLYQWLKSQHLDVELEKYIPDIQQQPDIFLSLHNKKIAIEFQCARISSANLKARLDGYQKLGIQSIWILGANHFHRQGQHVLKMNGFLQLFIHQFKTSQLPKIYFFCPKTSQFIIFQDFYYTRLNYAMGQCSITSLESTLFTHLFINKPLPKQILLSQWQKEKHTFRLRQNLPYGHGQESKWLQWLYLQQTYKEHLPSIIYLPVTHHFKMKSAPWNWQSRLCLDMIAPLNIGHIFSLNDCIRFLRTHIYPQDAYPLVQTETHPVMNYLQQLELFGFVKKQADTLFMKQKSFHYHQHVEKAVENDNMLVKHLYNLLKTAYKHE